jgi:hypothetical protein
MNNGKSEIENKSKSEYKAKRIAKIRVKKKNKDKINLKWLIIIGYISYLLLILLSQIPLLAEQYAEEALINNDVVEYHLTFETEGRQSHYYVELTNTSNQGTIDIYYYPKTNTLKTNLVNIKNLTIYSRSMYLDECNEVFGFDPIENSNYYKWFFIEKNHLNVNIDSDSAIGTLKFIDVPKPSAVYVDGTEWSEGTRYTYNPSNGVAISNISSGSTNVDIYFKSTSSGAPVALITASRIALQINESIVLNGSKSYDPDPEGFITNYIWDFGDGNYSTSTNVVNHHYTRTGTYGIILTVVDNDFKIGHAYLNITVSAYTGLEIRGYVPHVTIMEDCPTENIELRWYEPFSIEPEMNYFWYLTGEDTKRYSVSGENSSDDTIMITPVHNQFGNNSVILWLEDNLGGKVYQQLWINITPVNDPPTIFGIPDITIHYNVPYEFNYILYINDVDTPMSKLVLNSSDSTHTSVHDFNVSYNYPKSMLGDTEYVILTIWDGDKESSDVVAVWITDDWVPNLIKPLPNVYLDEGEVYINYFDLDDYFMDPDNDTLYYSYGYTHVNVIINTDHTVDFYAPNDWNGEEMTTFRATDPSGALIEDIITVTVRPINDPPIIKNVPNLIIRYDMDYVFDVSPYIYDEDTPLDELVLTSSDPNHIKIDNSNHLAIILNYPYRPNIPYTVTVTLTIYDGFNSSYQIITIRVKNNYPPILGKPFNEIVLYEDVPKLNALNLYDYFFDNDSTMLYFKVINNKEVISNINVNGSLDLSSAPNWSGREIITLRALDPDLAFIEGKLEVKVLPVNDAPIISEIPKQKFNASEKYMLDLRPYIFDIDNNITQLKIWLEDYEIDCEVHGTDILFYTTKPSSSTATLFVSDGSTETTQKILFEVSGETEEKAPILFEIITLIIIILIMLIGILGYIYRSYKGSYEVLELFVIYRNGLMLLHHCDENIHRDETDADIISAMFTAVQDFTRDSFAHGDIEDENWSLKKLEFKGNNILIERGEHVYLASVFIGKPGKRLARHLNNIKKEIEEKYSNVLENWTGDLDEVNGIDEIVSKRNLISNLNIKPPDEDFSQMIPKKTKNKVKRKIKHNSKHKTPL